MKRTDWGLNWNKALETGGMLVSDDVNLELDFEYVPKVSQAKKEAQTESKPRKN